MFLTQTSLCEKQHQLLLQVPVTQYISCIFQFLFCLLFMGLLVRMKRHKKINNLCKVGEKLHLLLEQFLQILTFSKKPSFRTLQEVISPSLLFSQHFLCASHEAHIRLCLELELFMHVSIFYPGLWTLSAQGSYFIHVSHPHWAGGRAL